MTEPVTTWVLPVTPEARAALTAAGELDIPEQITLLLRAATWRELRLLDASVTQAKADPFAPGVLVICRRASEPVSEAVAREVVQDLTPPELAELMVAYKDGQRDEGKTASAVRQTLSGMQDQLMTALGSAISLSSTSSMDSTPHGETTSPPGKAAP